MTGTLVFVVLAAVVVLSALAMLFSRNAIYAAIFLVFNFSVVAVFYLILGAPFIAMAQVTVYAGAIMVLFLFVIMLLGGERLPMRENIRGQRVIGLALGVVFIAEAGLLLVWRGGSQKVLEMLSLDFASPAAIGMALFNRYLLPFEITSAILLVALIGAIVLTKSDQSIRKDLQNKE